MPGVPGRSKGCTTCRRRKVRCDLGVPWCNRCIKGDRMCEGYETYPIFLNRTAQGANKRHRLEEAKPDFSSAPVQAVVFANDWKQIIPAVVNSQDNHMPSQLSASTAFDSQIIALFFEKYLPADKRFHDRYGRAWLQQAIGLQNPGEALHLSLKAMSMTTIGRLCKDDRLAFQGGVCYGRALQQLRKALQSEISVWQDETLAAGFILALYELFQSESDIALEAWHKHMSGLERLVSMRGPRIYRSRFGSDMLEDIRSSLMVSCIKRRRTSVLANGRWLARPWDETADSLHPRIYDKGFLLAALQQDIDKANLASADTSIPVLSQFLQRSIDLDTDLNMWYEEFLIRSPSPSYWPTPPSTNTKNQEDLTSSGPRGLPLLSYPSLLVASMTLAFWAVKLILSNEIASICHIIFSNHRADTSGTESTECLMLTAMAHRAEDQYGHQYRINLATDIVRSMPYCLNHSMGLLGPERAFFALRPAVATLRRYPGSELNWCRAAQGRIEERSGLRGVMKIHSCLYEPRGSEGLSSSPPLYSDSSTQSASESEVETSGIEGHEEPIRDCMLTKGLKRLRVFLSAHPPTSFATSNILGDRKSRSHGGM